MGDALGVEQGRLLVERRREENYAGVVPDADAAGGREVPERQLPVSDLLEERALESVNDPEGDVILDLPGTPNRAFAQCEAPPGGDDAVLPYVLPIPVVRRLLHEDLDRVELHAGGLEAEGQKVAGNHREVEDEGEVVLGAEAEVEGRLHGERRFPGTVLHLLDVEEGGPDRPPLEREVAGEGLGPLRAHGESRHLSFTPHVEGSLVVVALREVGGVEPKADDREATVEFEKRPHPDAKGPEEHGFRGEGVRLREDDELLGGVARAQLEVVGLDGRPLPREIPDAILARFGLERLGLVPFAGPGNELELLPVEAEREVGALVVRVAEVEHLEPPIEGVSPIILRAKSAQSRAHARLVTKDGQGESVNAV